MSKSYPQVLLFGDSILQMSSYLGGGFSFGAVLAEHCIRAFDVINRGLSGYTTANVLLILQNIIPPPEKAKVAYMVILFGSNDACLPDGPSHQHVPLEDYRKNMKTILNHPAVRAQDPTILLVTPPPVNESQFPREHYTPNGEPARQPSVTAKYADAIREIASESDNKKLILLDLHSVMMKKAQTMIGENGESLDSDAALRTLLSDGLHLTGAGYKIFVEEVLPHIEVPDRVFPDWRVAPRIDRA